MTTPRVYIHQNIDNTLEDFILLSDHKEVVQFQESQIAGLITKIEALEGQKQIIQQMADSVIETLNAEITRLNQKYDFQLLVKQNDELKAENAKLKAEIWVLSDRQLRTYDGRLK